MVEFVALSVFLSRVSGCRQFGWMDCASGPQGRNARFMALQDFLAFEVAPVGTTVNSLMPATARACVVMFVNWPRSLPTLVTSRATFR
jgi:hypothetical protein